MRELHTVEIKISTAKAWGNFALCFSGMLLCWYFLWTFFDHSTDDSPIGPFVFLLIFSVVSPFGCLGAYAQAKAGPRTRYTLTSNGLIVAELGNRLIAWEIIERTYLRYLTFGRGLPHALLIIQMDDAFVELLGLRKLERRLGKFFGKVFGMRGIVLVASGLEVSPRDLSHIVEYYHRHASGGQTV